MFMKILISNFFFNDKQQVNIFIKIIKATTYIKSKILEGKRGMVLKHNSI